ncbi:hypothetical protein ABZ858_11730 [Streptomyces sp. NPDC047017]|uniref:SCO4225 family membrane protein n=1 Tax=Streptomyces sp. NPDC047017 TaxID=3155024 RepID=UPI003405A010
MNSHTSSRPSPLLATLRAHWMSTAYLVVVAAVCVWVLIDQTLVSHADASFSGVWPVFLTAPVSLLLLVLPGDSPLGYAVCVALGAAVDAWLLRRLERAVAAPRR